MIQREVRLLGADDNADGSDGAEPEGDQPQEDAHDEPESFESIANREGSNSQQILRDMFWCLQAKRDASIGGICSWANSNVHARAFGYFR